MTEDEWLAASEPRGMLRHIVEGEAPPVRRAGARELRLFAAACCRAVWDGLKDERSRRAVEVAELFVDGEATETEMGEANRAASSAELISSSPPVASDLASWVADNPISSVVETVARYSRHLGAEVQARQAVFLRDIFGNPFRPVGRAALPRCLACGGDGPCRLCEGHGVPPTVLSLAVAAYRERPATGHLDNVRLSVLSDALEEAGCTSADLLSHLRSPGPHVRGCWALDLALGR